MKATLNLDYSAVEQGHVTIKSQNGDWEKIAAEEVSSNDYFFEALVPIESAEPNPDDGIVQIGEEASLVASYGYDFFRKETAIGVAYDHNFWSMPASFLKILGFEPAKCRGPLAIQNGNPDFFLTPRS